MITKAYFGVWHLVERLLSWVPPMVFFFIIESGASIDNTMFSLAGVFSLPLAIMLFLVYKIPFIIGVIFVD